MRVQLQPRLLFLASGIILATVVSLAVPRAARAQNQDDDEAWIIRQRNDFVSSVNAIPVGRPDRSRGRELRSDLEGLRGQLLTIWTLRFAPMSEEWARADFEEHSEVLLDTLRRLREHVNADSDPPDSQPEILSGESFQEQMDSFLRVGLRLNSGINEVLRGEILDLDVLSLVRTDFATLEFWTRQVRDSLD